MEHGNRIIRSSRDEWLYLNGKRFSQCTLSNASIFWKSLLSDPVSHPAHPIFLLLNPSQPCRTCIFFFPSGRNLFPMGSCQESDETSAHTSNPCRVLPYGMFHVEGILPISHTFVRNERNKSFQAFFSAWDTVSSLACLLFLACMRWKKQVDIRHRKDGCRNSSFLLWIRKKDFEGADLICT